MQTKFRWAIRNKNTGTIRGSKATRIAARDAKRSLGGNYGIFDMTRGVFVR